MITVYPFDQLGHVNHIWLDTRHHFSFAEYHNAARMQFGALRVINDDIIAAEQGFAMHPHRNMEIITYVRSGAITHQDSLNNKGRTEAGSVQVMSAGTGVLHSEHNHENEATQLYQIWITPNQQQVQPRWETRQFPKAAISNGTLPLLVSGRKEDANKNALFIYQDAAIYGGVLRAGSRIEQPIKYQAYLLASVGNFKINDVSMKQGDGAEVTHHHSITLSTETDAEIIIIDVPF